MTEVRYSSYSSDILEQYDSDDTITPGDAYAAALKVDSRLVRGGAFILKNGGSNSITYKVLGSMKSTVPANDSDNSWYTIKSDTALASGASAVESYDVEYAWIWVMAKNTTGGQANTLRVYHRGMN